MRWPLRNQIVVPLLGLTLTCLIGLSALHYQLSVGAIRRQIEQHLQRVTDTLLHSQFPLTASVLRQMSGLSGAEFVLTDRGQHVAASTADSGVHRLAQREVQFGLALGRAVAAETARFFHAAIQVQRPRGDVLHVFYPESVYKQAIWTAVYPSLFVGGAAIGLTVLLSIVIAAQVTRPLSRLRGQVHRIANGDFQAMPIPRRNDEISELSQSINQMTLMLAQYEDEVRRTERLRTLGQLGSGIAHQLRNSVTGCRIAVDLHARGCHENDQESLRVAERQLELMERYVRRFLSLGSQASKPHQPIELHQLCQDVVSLVGPTARHLHVDLQVDAADDSCLIVSGDREALEQVLVNLLLNAIEATSQDGESAQPGEKLVRLRCRHQEGAIVLEVRDTGPGPDQAMQDRLFEPFTTDRADGTGLGLAVAREIVAAHAGEIRWERVANETCFIVELPSTREPLVS